MIDPSNQNGQHGTGVNWRLKLSKDRSAAVLDSPIVLELSDARGSTLATLSIPSETMNELLRPHLVIFTELQMDGSVSLDTEFFALPRPPPTSDVLELVRRALAPEMLEDEPEAAQMLAKFRLRLLKSLELVEQAIASLPKD